MCGAYYVKVMAEEALKQNIEVIPSELVGKKTSTDKISYCKFAVDGLL